MKNLFFSVVGTIFICMGCGSDNNKDAKDCSEAICTDVYVSIPVTVLYEDGSPVILDSYEVRELETGRVRNVPNWGTDSHTYTIATDGDREDFYNKKVKLQLIGKIAGKIILQENYTVTADCCHISLLEGNKEVVIK